MAIVKGAGLVMKAIIEVCIANSLIIPPTNKVWGVYRNHPVRPSVRPSIHVPCKRNSS